MDVKKLVMVLGGIDLILVVVCAFLYFGKDRTLPVITFGENDVVYEEGMDQELLLQGVTAKDGRDGDVTDSLLIEKIGGTSGKEVIVTYVARDKMNNVAKASRVFAVAEGSGETDRNENGMNDGENGDVVQAAAMGDVVNAGVAGAGENVNEAGDMNAADGMEGNGAAIEGGELGAQTGNENGVADDAVNVDPTAPVLNLNSEILNTSIGRTPDWKQVIEELSDDKDTYNQLYRNLKLEGKVDVRTAGEYPVALYTIDSEGKRSEIRGLVVRVE